MKAATLSILLLSVLSNVTALPSQDRKTLVQRVYSPPPSNAESNAVTVNGYTSTALSYLDPQHESQDALKKALSNPSQSYDD